MEEKRWQEESMMKLMPSIASANPLDIEGALKSMDGWPYLHVDIEDGNFVPNITFGMKTVRAICAMASDKQIQVHLMTVCPEQYLEGLAGCGVDAVIAHIEALDYPMQFLNHCKSLGMKAGLACNMKTSIDGLWMFRGLADQLLLMTSEPDFAGEELYEPALERVIRLAGTIPAKTELYVDGGVTEPALMRLRKAGVHGAVLGRLVFQAPHPMDILRETAQTKEEI